MGLLKKKFLGRLRPIAGNTGGITTLFSVRYLILTSDIDIKTLFSKVDSPCNKPLLACRKTKNAKSGFCSRRINFRKQYFYIDIGVELR